MDLERFEKAQEHTFDIALKEILNGRKHSHWIWYVFPQLKGLGHSYRSRFYGIANKEEANAYLDHPVLGQRLRVITKALLAQPEERTATDILGEIDAIKVASSMTLFYAVSKDPLFHDVINRFYGGRFDELTLNRL